MKTIAIDPFQHRQNLWRTLFGLGMVFLTLTACAGAKPPYNVTQYGLDYTPAPTVLPVGGDATVRVERFSISQMYNSYAIIYRSEPFVYDIYAYDRWRANPADLATDFFVRDLRLAGVFRSVFTYRDAEEARFRLKGAVEEWLEWDDSRGRTAVLSIHLQLLDGREKDSTRQVVFQKRYRIEEPYLPHTVQGLAAGMSRAMESFSRQAIQDLAETVSRAGS